MRYTYVATAYTNRRAVDAFRKRLPDGWKLSYDWTIHTFDDNPRTVCANDLMGIAMADVVVFIMPGKVGSHVELGYALGLKKHVIFVGRAWPEGAEWPECPFYLHPNILHVPDTESAIKLLEGWKDYGQID